MRYQGGKVKASRYYAPIFNSLIQRHGFVNYYEPFCGSLAVAEKINCKNIFCSDANQYLIELYKALQNGWLPPISISEKDYTLIKANPEKFDKRIVAFAGLCGFGGKWLDTFARHTKIEGRVKIITTTGKQPPDYSHEVFKSIIRLRPVISDWGFKFSSYEKITVRADSLVYCDPPYEKTVGYRAIEGCFDSAVFWDWVRGVSKIKDCLCIISEYQAPKDFVSIHTFRSNKINNNVGGDKIKKCDYLFIHKSQIDLIR